MKKLFLFLIISIFCNAMSLAQVFDVSTGMNGASPITLGSTDPEWFVSKQEFIDYVPAKVVNGVCGMDPGTWSLSSSCGQWITKTVCSNPNNSGPENADTQEFFYKYEFTLSGCCGFSNASNLVINELGADNWIAAFKLNGNLLNYNPTGVNMFGTLSGGQTFSNIAGFLQNGLNTLLVQVHSYGGPQGLLMCGALSVVGNPQNSCTPTFLVGSSFCEGQSFTCTALPSTIIATQHFWEIVESNAIGTPVAGAIPSSFPGAGNPTSHTFPGNLACGKHYRIRLGKSLCGTTYYHSSIVYIKCSPVASLGENVTGCLGQGVMIQNSECLPNISYSWNSPGICLQGNCNTNACVSGNYCLTATDLVTGCSKTDCALVTLNECSDCVIKKVTAKPKKVEGLCSTFTFDANLEFNDVATIVIYHWDFGDGTTSNEYSPTHTYLHNGTYIGHLTVYAMDSEGNCCIQDKAFTITVDCECKVLPLQPEYTPTDNCGEFVFSVPTGPEWGTTQLMNVKWTFSDGSIAYGNPVTHSFAESGSYYVIVSAMGSNGSTCCEGDPKTIEIGVDCNMQCSFKPKFEYIQQEDGSISFYNTTDNNDGSPILGYIWDFGDDDASSDPNPNHQYSGPGEYTVCLHIFGGNEDKCCSDKECMTIIVYEPKKAIAGEENNSSLAQVTNLLSQNAPNPFDQKTTIKYSVPNEYKMATLDIYNTEGKLINSYRLNGEKNGNIVIEGGTLKPGVYTYHLIVDGAMLDAKKMILIRN